MARGTFIWKDGIRLAVVRPDDPEKAIQLAREQIGAEDPTAFELILWSQPYRYIGILGTKEQILDNGRKIIGNVQPGDSFMCYESLVNPPRGAPAKPPIQNVPTKP